MGEVLLDLLLLLVLSRAFWKLVGGFMAGLQPRRSAGQASQTGSRTTASVHMERDPVCGTFVVPDRAVVLNMGREHLYFCSSACRDRYQSAQGRAS
jgi:YHS domain-containing protein